ncbi:MAG TPA: transketolase [Anaerolineales bacterium]|nr:transketolase [Anaerolineales bacterium]
MTQINIDTLSVNTLRFLSADGVQNANSGHPGLPMGAAAMAYILWTRFLKHDPHNPHWADRDRFVLSGGHGSMLLYSLLHLTGYDLSLDDLKAFRQFGSKTPGHPEAHLTPGVEATTGPLGQGLSNAVGMAIAEAHLAAQFNQDGHSIVDHYTYVLASDGDLMEGVASEACSLAGHLRLGKLIVLYDDNKISLAGTTSLSYTEDAALRFAAYGWQILRVSDGNDLKSLDDAIRAAQGVADQPTLILVRTIIGYGAPEKQNTFEAHGSPLGPDELKRAKENLGWPVEPMFLVPGEALENFRGAMDRGKNSQSEWGKRFAAYEKKYPELAAEFKRRMAGDLPANWDAALPSFPADPKGLATRKASEAALQTLAKTLPELIGGSADLNPSTFTWLKGEGDFESPHSSPEGSQGRVGGAWGYAGRNLHFGVREHGMGAIVNGMALHGGVRPYSATFFVFSDYMRPTIRLAAISELPSIFVFTHDSIGLGEDGPTHQPVEHLAAVRAIPHLVTIRPGDANESVEAWRFAINHRSGPVVLVFTRQNVPTLDRSKFAPASNLSKGAYVLWDSAPNPQTILMSTGSEVELIVKAGEKLAAEGVAVRLVSMPSWELFEKQTKEYRDSVLLPTVRARVAIEAGVRQGWDRYLGERGVFIGLDRFGASAPAKVVYENLGLTVEAVVAAAKTLLG